MGGTMSARHTTPAEDTVALLQRAAQSGLPVLIPGAFEMRAGRPAVRPASAAAAAETPHAHAAASSRAQLEREREGGGAPSERRAGRHRTIFARLWRRMFRPPDLPAIWPHPLPEDR
ncbi:MAG: hypothetical protein DMF89_06545 [Acidobacteria bacterium]|nr:MAG: hypothetical protein DMF89_06545 [Acidobacteriota bacterium]